MHVLKETRMIHVAKFEISNISIRIRIKIGGLAYSKRFQ